jgi:SAM-dependent methyltransferase
MSTKKKQRALHRHYLYTSAVQSVEADLKFFRKVYRKHRGKTFRHMREDFCGTAVLAHEFVRRNKENEAWGVDLDQETLDWGTEHYTPRLGDGADRLHLMCKNVLDVVDPKVDVVNALNFSYSVFKDRESLGGYFKKVRESLRDDGVFFIDAWGGSDTMQRDREHRKVDPEEAFDGTDVPGFVYTWEQESFNPVDHQIVCHIHFRTKKGKRMRKAFTYDWRLWMLPELQELMLEAGFASTEVYVEGWDDKEDEPDGIFRKKKRFDNSGGWVAYVVGIA